TWLSPKPPVVPCPAAVSDSCLLCSVMDFYSTEVQLRWFQGQQELSGHVVTTDVVPNGDWTYQIVEIQLESRSESSTKLMSEVDTVTLLGHKPW
ncbi:HB2B protein, partial [Falcunculus frontatus]|nr:HB2B protein [Falcunculus frontatus]